MFPRTFPRVLAASALGAVVAGLVAPSAVAAAPTRITDRTVEIACSATGTAGEDINFYVASSDLGGTFGAVQAFSSTGDFLAGGEGTSDWSGTTFRSAVEVLGPDDSPLGTAYLSGSYRAAGAAERFTSKFKDGNIRVVEDHSFTPLAVGDLVLELPGVEVADVSCDGSLGTGSLFFTNPTAHVGSDSGLEVQDCSLINAQDFFIDGRSLDDLAVGLSYADTPDMSAFSPSMDLTGGSWTGTFNAADDQGPTPVAATVTLRQTGDTVTTRNSGPEGSIRLVVTPYEMHITVAGPKAPAEVTCQLTSVDVRFREMRH